LHKYLEKNTIKEVLIQSKPNPNLGIVVTIPCYNEPSIIQILKSLANCAAPEKAVEVIVNVNNSEDAEESVIIQNQKTINEINQFQNDSPFYKLFVINCCGISSKLKGVGVTRKIAMDEAARRLADVNNLNGLITGLDADCKVSKNYFTAIELAFQNNPKASSASIYFEHPIKGDQHPANLYEAIIDYELHLRYFKNAKAWAGLKDAYYTVGSSMVVRAKDYMAQGGMNKRQAAEDFYFIHKFTALGKHIEINDCTVFPSPRISDRVPFGTGKAIGEIIEIEAYKTYAIESFKDLKKVIELLNQLSHKIASLIDVYESCPNSFKSFLSFDVFKSHCEEISKNTSSPSQFEKRLFKWINAFFVMKYVHHCRDYFYPNVNVLDAYNELAKVNNWTVMEGKMVALEEIRNLDKRIK
jgi:hypothetical protein